MDDNRVDLSGTWQGLYSYSDGTYPTSFVAVVIDAAASIGGTTHEQCAFQEVPGGFLYATLRGQRAGSTVTFVKTYDGTGGWEHSVDYEGTVNEDGTEITGEWRLQGGSGPFLMMRANGKEDALPGKARQPVSVS